MISQRIRVYNDCSECRIKMRVYSRFPFSGLILTLEDFGDVGPDCFQEIHFDVGQSTKHIRADDIKGCKEIRFTEKNGMIIIKVIQGNYFERIGIVWKLKDFASKMKEFGEKIKKKFVKRAVSNKHVNIREPFLRELLWFNTSVGNTIACAFYII
ncbi:hypothetical protein L484_002923 [Morus notabilis]|uniref:Uncharacterized protein n=1 Tax=Morus notabilis TaxID=981085 RepID=W9QRE8_9ROSA|nr:hypothetical protein L484_002923 [Morus notabilis]